MRTSGGLAGCGQVQTSVGGGSKSPDFFADVFCARPFTCWISGSYFLVCSGSIMITTLDCEPEGPWFKSREGARILRGQSSAEGLPELSSLQLGVNQIDSYNFELCLQGRLCIRGVVANYLASQASDPGIDSHQHQKDSWHIWHHLRKEIAFSCNFCCLLIFAWSFLSLLCS